MFRLLMSMFSSLFAFFSNFFDKAKAFGLALVAFAIANGVPVHAAITAPTLDTADPTTIATAVIAGLAALWGILKAVSVMKRG